jgi:phosphate transport system permease protein
MVGKGIYFALLASVSLTVITSAAVIVMLGKESLDFFSQVPIMDFLFGRHWEPLLEPKSFGVLPLMSGTFLIVAGATSIALPFGLLIAVYLSEYAPYKFKAIIKPVLEVLAGIPTVVYGFFALTFITPVLKSIWPQTEVFNAASAFIVVGIMILPMVTSLSDDAFSALPGSLKEGAYALGATPFEVSTQVIIPAASSRVWASVILAISRAVGETMAVTLAAGANPKLTLNPLESIQTMTAYIVQVSLGDTPQGGVEYLTCFAVGALLFVLTWVMNAVGSYFIFNKGR